jgi:lipopolysaccharide/colanic/teichoic acid biosynthesis glycosyltransferase
MKLDRIARRDAHVVGIVPGSSVQDGALALPLDGVLLPDAVHGAEEAADRFGARLYRQGLKRAFDIAFTLMLAPLLVPLVALLALMVMTDGHGPFYSQARVGRGGRIYRIWKLRSMVPNAEAALATHLATDPAAAAEWAHHQKLANDPRITPVGRFLRTFSLDELPQFWNVLKGDMSLVGPRPMMPDQVALYPGESYFALRPGITGPWQVSDRHATSFAARAEFDDAYFARLSLGADLRFVLTTVFVVVRGTGC